MRESSRPKAGKDSRLRSQRSAEQVESAFRKVCRPEGGMVLRGEIGMSVSHANGEAFCRACVDFQNEVR